MVVEDVQREGSKWTETGWRTAVGTPHRGHVVHAFHVVHTFTNGTTIRNRDGFTALI